MSFNAKVLEVMIASPGGLNKERDVVEAVVSEWNSANAEKEGIVLLVRRWERDASVELSGAPQAMINDHVLASSDVLIGIFHTRLGTPTSEHESGTVEEIKRHYEANKPVMLFFSERAVKPGSYDVGQFNKVQELKAWATPLGIYASFKTPIDFRLKLNQKLPHTLNRNAYLKSLTKIDFVKVFDGAVPDPATAAAPGQYNLSDDARELLRLADISAKGEILRFPGLKDNVVRVPGQNLVTDGSPRETARWEEALSELTAQGFVKDSNGNRIIFRVTHSGFAEADRLKNENSAT